MAFISGQQTSCVLPRKIEVFTASVFVSRFRSNLAFECQHIVHSIQAAGIKKWVALQEGAGHTIGWLTTNERKESMCMQLRDAMRVGNIAFSDQFFSTTQGLREVKQQLEDELRNFCILVEAAKTPFGKVKKTVSASSHHPATPTLYSRVLSMLRSTRARWAAATTTWYAAFVKLRVSVVY